MYYVIETQENLDGTASVLPVHTKQSKNEAISTWHSILASAAISDIYIHSCIILDSELKVVERGSFIHKPVQSIEVGNEE